MSTRKALPSDEPEVVALWRTCDLVTAYNDPSADFHFAISGPCSDVLVRENASGRIVGSVMVGHDGHRGWLYYVATAPGARRIGVGRTMVEAGQQWLRERGITKVQLLVRESNARVVAFYERLGFEISPRIVMSKWLR
jgi:ribosomal protein S18 acetylase RimI-like enzyme